MEGGKEGRKNSKKKKADSGNIKDYLEVEGKRRRTLQEEYEEEGGKITENEEEAKGEVYEEEAEASQGIDTPIYIEIMREVIEQGLGKGIEELKGKLEKIENELKKERENREAERKLFLEEIQSLKRRIEETKLSRNREQVDLKRLNMGMMNNMRERMLRVERNVHQKELIIKGLEEEEPGEKVEDKVVSLLQDKLEIKNVKVKEAFRIGKRQNWNRPVKFVCEHKEEVEQIMKEKSKLRGTRIYIEREMNVEERIELNELRKENSRLRREGKRAVLKGKYIVTDEAKYKWDWMERKVIRCEEVETSTRYKSVQVDNNTGDGNFLATN